MSKTYTVVEPLQAVRTYVVVADSRLEAVDMVMMGRAGQGDVTVLGPTRLLNPEDARVTYDPSRVTECVSCGHPVRKSQQLVTDHPGTRVAVNGVCSLCRRGGGQEIVTHCMVCDRRLRDWGARASEDPEGVQRGDAKRCIGCKFGNKEVLTVDELNENDTQWVKNNVPSDLHWYFGVAND